MIIKCEICETSEWKIAIRELSKKMRLGSFHKIVVVLECENCGMSYPFFEFDREFAGMVGSPMRKEKLITFLQGNEPE